MSQTEFGIEGLTDEDRGYAGSRFADVVDALLANPYQRIWGGAGEPPLPIYDVTFGSVTKGIVPSAMHGLLRQASDRAIESFADLRWGPDRKGFRRLLHPNAVCLIGQWQITEETPYSGHFAKGSRALTVCRYSTCCTETHRGHMRSLSMVGKLFPTMDPAHATPLRTANFITQSDIGGEPTEYINDAELRNAPDLTVSRRGFGVPILLATGAVFSRVDKEPGIRQLYPVAELGKPAGQPTRAPQFMRLLVSSGQPRIDGDALDFRDEVLAQIFDRGNPTPKRTLTFTIDVTDDGTSSGSPFRVRRTFENWRRIGALTFDNAVASYNGDFVIHFNHPAWREDRNDPTTAKRLSK